MKSSGLVLDPEVSVDVEPGVVTLYDRSRFANHGTMTNVTWVQIPPFGLWVMSFNGTSSKVTILVALIPEGDWTLSYWVWGSSAVEGTFREMFAQDIIGDGGFYLGHTNAVPAFMRIGGEAFAGAPVVAYPFDAWHHMALVKKTGANASAFYLDTVLQGNLTFILQPDDPDFRIGCQYGPHGEYWNGYISSVRAHSYALSPGQILKHFEATRRFFGR